VTISEEAIVGILKEQYFDGRRSLFRVFPQEFKQTLATEDGGKGLEMPPKLVALVATFVRFIADAYTFSG
jgi:hypothetical protein